MIRQGPLQRSNGLRNMLIDLTYIPGIDPKSVAEHKLAHAVNKVFEDARSFVAL